MWLTLLREMVAGWLEAPPHALSLAPVQAPESAGGTEWSCTEQVLSKGKPCFL